MNIGDKNIGSLEPELLMPLLRSSETTHLQTKRKPSRGGPFLSQEAFDKLFELMMETLSF